MGRIVDRHRECERSVGDRVSDLRSLLHLLPLKIRVGRDIVKSLGLDELGDFVARMVERFRRHVEQAVGTHRSKVLKSRSNVFGAERESVERRNQWCSKA